jgi:hypothetical protein
MPVGPIEPRNMDNEVDADDYLKDLFSDSENRSMNVVMRHSEEINEHIREHFINKGREMLKYGDYVDYT